MTIKQLDTPLICYKHRKNKYYWFQYQYKINKGLKEQAEWMLAQEND